MSLERFRRARMIVLTSRATAYQAARAMADNHIGSVLVSEAGGIAGIVTDRDLALAVLGGDLDPKTTPLGEVMSEGVIICDISAGLDEVVRLMRDEGIRRIPITEGGRLVGLITFDDLVVDGSIDLDALKSIVTAQLEVEAPQKPAGVLHPQAFARAEQPAAGRARALMRAQARAEATYNRLVLAIASAAALDRDRAERALLIGTCMLCRRLVPEEAQDLIAQLPSKLQPQLRQCLDGPDRAVTVEAIREELARMLGLDFEGADVALRSVFKTIGGTVTAGQIDEVRGQLPEAMKHLFPSPVHKIRAEIVAVFIGVDCEDIVFCALDVCSSRIAAEHGKLSKIDRGGVIARRRKPGTALSDLAASHES
jgi:CBS domain-containing protein/uncharacterized protein (DUF2267 family)